MTDQPWKRQAKSKQLIANMYLHHYMNDVMKTHITLHLSLPHISYNLYSQGHK